MTFVVLRNEERTHTTMMAMDDVTAEDRVAYDGTAMATVHVFEARTREVADALFEQWMEREEQDPHRSGCWDGGECWCSS